MKAERLLAYYEQVADAPDAVTRLRRFILDLAVHGKLVPQDAVDEPASELMKRIVQENARLVKLGKIRYRPAFPLVSEKDAPFKIPASWLWTRLANVVDFSSGKTPSRHDPSFWNNGDYPWVSIADMEDGQVLYATKETVSARARDHVFGSMPAEPGTIIMSYKLTIGKIARLGVSAFHNEAIVSIRPHIAETDRYIFKFLPQFARQGKTVDAIKGATLNRESISNILLPLPPLTEQYRIVAKVDELMKLCDRLEAARADREVVRDRIAAASLARVNTPGKVVPRPSASVSNSLPNTLVRTATPATVSSLRQDADGTFAEHTRPFLDTLPALTARQDQIKALRQLILDFAVRGKLVRQDTADELAVELLGRLKKAKIIACEKEGIRERPPINKIDRLDTWFGFPESWAFCHFDDIFAIMAGVTKGQNISANEAMEIPYLRVANVQRGYLDLSVIKKITIKITDKDRYAIKRGDILMTEGGDWDKLGRAAIWNEEIPKCIHQNHVFRVRPPSKDILSEWVTIYANSLIGRSYFENASKQTTNLASINMTQLRGCPLPLPPLAEQHRIVTKVDELMKLCNKLEASLTTAANLRRRLLDALLAAALDPDEDRLLEAAE